MAQPEDKATPGKITVERCGPYWVSSVDNLRDANDRLLPIQEETALCRCGRSDDKPYCDGTHFEIGFIGAKDPRRVPDRVDEYDAPGITIVDNRGVCAHAAVCTDTLPSVFKRGAKPWIDPTGATVEEIIALVERCPSGALSYKIDGVRHQNVGGPPAIRVTKNGPYRVTGGIALEDDQGSKPETTDHYTLCRCGASKNMPFCSGAHWKGFEDDGTCKRTESD